MEDASPDSPLIRTKEPWLYQTCYYCSHRIPLRGADQLVRTAFLAIQSCVQLNLSHPSKWESQWQNNCFVSSSSENVPNKGKTPVSRSKWIKTRNEGRRSGVTLSPPPFDSIPSICKQAAVGGQLGLQEKAIVTNDTATSIGRIERANSI